MISNGWAEDTCSQPHPRESFICGWNSFVGIPKPIIGIHRNDLLIEGIKKIQENQLLAMGGLKTRVPSPTHRNLLFAAGNLS